MASIQKKNNKYCVVYYCKDIGMIFLIISR